MLSKINIVCFMEVEVCIGWISKDINLKGTMKVCVNGKLIEIRLWVY